MRWHTFLHTNSVGGQDYIHWLETFHLIFHKYITFLLLKHPSSKTEPTSWFLRWPFRRRCTNIKKWIEINAQCDIDRTLKLNNTEFAPFKPAFRGTWTSDCLPFTDSPVQSSFWYSEDVAVYLPLWVVVYVNILKKIYLTEGGMMSYR